MNIEKNLVFLSKNQGQALSESFQGYLATHDGGFHADDVVGCSVWLLSIAMRFPDLMVSRSEPKAPSSALHVVRTRDVDIIKRSKVAIDVGGIHDVNLLRFDHHQKGFDLRRKNGIPFASAGLVWMALGPHVVNVVSESSGLGSVDDPTALRVAALVDKDFISMVDAEDSGFERPAKGRFGFSAIIDSMVPTWEETNGMDSNGRGDLQSKAFHESVIFAARIVERAILDAMAVIRAEQVVTSSERMLEGRLLLLPRSAIPWHGAVSRLLPGVLLCAYPDSSGGQWQLATIPVEEGSFIARMNLPEEWAGLRDSDLAKVTGVEDAVFCHNGRFISGARSRDGVIQMAKLALS